jgi:hypothetical protein
MLELPDHHVIPMAREIVQICLQEIAAEGRLHALQLDDFVGQLATGLLADCLQSHQLKLEMIERWTMEAAAHLFHAHGQCVCGHMLRSDRERTKQQCIECRVMLLMHDTSC